MIGISVGVGVGTGIGAGRGVVPPETKTCAVAETLLPEALVAVIVYTVVEVGITARLPVKATFPIPWSILTILAPETLQLSVEDWPAEIVSGFAVNESITASDEIAGIGMPGK